ncbi:hypothetical protein FQR65_LT02493 [Abscondita terminalis]|nr:hypothetical protein FQR65_LT02493 [Abscondita terminalis]
MILDILYERSGLDIIYRWGDSRDCHFPLFTHMQIPTFSTMTFIYSIMMAGAVGVTIGYKFYYSTFMFASCYWYILLLDKTYWNNHSYLFGLVSILLFGTSANMSYSVDSVLNKDVTNKTIPFWNYFILRFQFFILYFMAGLKKTDTEWLGGYSMVDLGHHWVFVPFQFILSTKHIDFFIVHFMGFLLDLTIGFWLISPTSRPYAMIFSSLFHIMNSRLFSIGMFPYVCIATTPIFCDYDWPEHFIGYNNWTNGLYGYSWDMMIHSWNSGLVVLRVMDNSNGNEYFIDPDVWTQNQRWNKHADMCIQYAYCLKNNLIQLNGTSISADKNWPVLSNNISIFIDVWCSLNNRFQQRMFDPNYDLLTAKWSPFEKVSWLLPLMTESDDFRSKLQQLQEYVYSWSNFSDVLFVADFPGMYLENYLDADLVNVTLTVLGGAIIYETENANKQSISVKLSVGSSYNVVTKRFHKIYTEGMKPSLYMYTFVNRTKEELGRTF